MPIVILHLPDFKRKTEIRSHNCPQCGGEIPQRWGGEPVSDNRYINVHVYRYCCCHCVFIFRQYPLGIDQIDQTQRSRKLAALFWELEMSL